MSIEFKFVLDDVDAETLSCILQTAKANALYEAILNAKENPAMANWYEAHAKYLEELKNKILANSKKL